MEPISRDTSDYVSLNQMGVKKIKCLICRKVFRYQLKLKLHMKTNEKGKLKCGNCSRVFQRKDHSSSHKKNCVDVPVEFLPSFLPMNDLSSKNNNELEQADIEQEADNSTEERINIESRLFHEDTTETINEKIETVEESNDESKVDEIEKENELGYIVKEIEIIINIRKHLHSTKNKAI